MKVKDQGIVSGTKTVVFSKPRLDIEVTSHNNQSIKSKKSVTDAVDSESSKFQNTDYIDIAIEKTIQLESEYAEGLEKMKISNNKNLIRLFLKKGEYIYARPNDIVMVESGDHLVKVYIIFDDKIKKTIRCNTLKDFLLQLPQNQFIRIGRFCAINLKRLSGGDYNQQTFEFDFKVSLKLKHSISCTAFNSIGI